MMNSYRNASMLEVANAIKQKLLVLRKVPGLSDIQRGDWSNFSRYIYSNNAQDIINDMNVLVRKLINKSITTSTRTTSEAQAVRTFVKMLKNAMIAETKKLPGLTDKQQSTVRGFYWDLELVCVTADEEFNASVEQFFGDDS